MADFLEDVREWIFQEAGLGLGANQIRTYIEPDRLTDPTITLYTGTTEAGVQTQDRPRPAIEYPHAQVTVRHRNVKEALRLANALHAFFYDTTAPYPYETIWPMHVPVRLGPPDGNARWSVGFAIRAQMVS